jgi:hypothetical protein
MWPFPSLQDGFTAIDSNFAQSAAISMSLGARGVPGCSAARPAHEAFPAPSLDTEKDMRSLHRNRS